MSDLIRLVAL